MSWFDVSFRSALRGCGVQGWAVRGGKVRCWGCVWFCFFGVERGVLGSRCGEAEWDARCCGLRCRFVLLFRGGAWGGGLVWRSRMRCVMSWFDVSFRSALRGCAVQGWAVGVGRCAVGGACGSAFSTWSAGWWGLVWRSRMRCVMSWFDVSFRSALWVVRYGVGRPAVVGACGSAFSTWSAGWWGVGVEKQNEMRDVVV